MCPCTYSLAHSTHAPTLRGVLARPGPEVAVFTAEECKQLGTRREGEAQGKPHGQESGQVCQAEAGWHSGTRNCAGEAGWCEYKHLLSVSLITLCPQSPRTWRPKGLTDHGSLPWQQAGSPLLGGRSYLSEPQQPGLSGEGPYQVAFLMGDRRIYKHVVRRRLLLTLIKGEDGDNVEAAKTLGWHSG